ncbi:cell wall protein DAN4 [Drosophila navojoa]|uniref:cell wall protein DAN4 n=1 Tax=Drosophila navojoa TaxID=7232 RepID=UPI000846643A|nr:cell wall protein DAN4 [Drosophila navojoa]
MNVLLVLLPVLLAIPIIAGKVGIAANTPALPNSIASREDLVTLSKYYVSIHQPYNVKKYVPYRPSNKTNILQIPSALLLPTVPMRTTPTPNNDFDWVTAEADIAENNDIPNYSTTETSTSTTAIPEMSTSLLSIIGTTPGVEATTPYYYINTIDGSTEENYLNSSTTEPTAEAAFTTSSLAPESEPVTSPTSFMETTTRSDFTTESTSTKPEAATEVENIKSAFHQFTTETTPTIDVTTNINWALPTTLSQPESPSTTEVPVFATQETSAEIEFTTNIASTTTQYTPESANTTDLPDTTNLAISTTESLSTTYFQTSTESPDITTSLPIFISYQTETSIDTPDTTTFTTTAESPSSTSFRVDTTTAKPDTTTTLAVTSTTETPESTTTDIPPTLTNAFAVESTTRAVIEDTTTAETATTTIKNAVFVDDIIKPKPRKFTYSSDVMPETDWE